MIQKIRKSTTTPGVWWIEFDTRLPVAIKTEDLARLKELVDKALAEVKEESK